MAMKDIERCEAPSGGPQEDIVSAAEEPDEGKICKSHDARTICRVAQYLAGDVRPAWLSVSLFHVSCLQSGHALNISGKSSISHDAEYDAHDPKSCHDDGLCSGRKRET
jgi:hypothetical protein